MRTTTVNFDLESTLIPLYGPAKGMSILDDNGQAYVPLSIPLLTCSSMLHGFSNSSSAIAHVHLDMPTLYFWTQDTWSWDHQITNSKHVERHQGIQSRPRQSLSPPNYLTSLIKKNQKNTPLCNNRHRKTRFLPTAYCWYF